VGIAAIAGMLVYETTRGARVIKITTKEKKKRMISRRVIAAFSP